MQLLNKDYLNLISTILNTDTLVECRNGKQYIIPFYSFSLNPKQEPKITLRKIYTKGIIGEFNTFIDPTPLTNISQFEANGCNYWKEWADLDGSINLDYHNLMHPQLENIIENIKKDPNSRRHILSLWDHDFEDYKNEISLACCWTGMNFSVIGETINMTWNQRSVDTMVGLPSDIIIARLFLEYVADKTNLTIGVINFSLTNVHIYEEHIEGARELLTRTKNIDYSEMPLKFEVKA